MAQELPENVKVLRLFGADRGTVDELVRSAHDKEQVHAESMHKGAETLVVVQAQAGSPQADRAALERWVRRVRAACGNALYGEGDTDLPTAAVQTLVRSKTLFVSADAATGALLEPRLEPLPDAGKVYDFGSQSYAHEKLGRRITAAGQKADGDLQRAAARLRAAHRVSGADYAVAYVPAGTGESWLLAGDGKGYWLRKISATEKPALWLLDMLRREALQQEQAAGAQWLRYGEQPPQLEPAGAEYAAPAAGAAVPPRRPQAAPAGEPAPEEDAPAPQKRPARHRGLTALLIVLVLALAAAGALWLYTGGDLASFWEKSGLGQFSTSGAAFLMLGGR